MPPPVPRHRLVGVDLLRLLTVANIVQCHVMPSEALKVITYSWNVPVFFVLTGYLWTPRRSLKEVVTRRWATLLVPYVFWLAVVLAGTLLFFTDRPGAVKGYLKSGLLGGTYAGRPFSAFWFVTALFAAAVLFWLLEHLALVWQVVLALAGLLVNCFYGAQLAKVPLSLATSLGVVGFLLVGRWLRSGPGRPTSWRSVAGWFVAGAALSASRLAEAPFYKDGDFGTPLLSFVQGSIMCIALISAAQLLAPRLPGAVVALVNLLSPTLLVVVLTHAAVLQALMDGSRPRPELGLSLWAIWAIAFALPALLGYALARSPLARMATGVQRVSS